MDPEKDRRSKPLAAQSCTWDVERSFFIAELSLADRNCTLVQMLIYKRRFALGTPTHDKGSSSLHQMCYLVFKVPFRAQRRKGIHKNCALFIHLFVFRKYTQPMFRPRWVKVMHPFGVKIKRRHTRKINVEIAEWGLV